jgi:hypothetical protein
MAISRRTFLGATGAAAVFGACSRSLASLRTRSDSSSVPGVVGFEGNCIARESFQGFRLAFPESVVLPSRPSSLWDSSRLIIVPAAALIDAGLAAGISSALNRGRCVLLESAMGFLEGAEFARAQQSLASNFEVSLGHPVDLWADGRRRIPYVDFHWPHPARVRDFSRVVRVPESNCEIIARADGIPVGMKRRHGRGTLLVLGSMLGPSLRSGDREALAWMREVLRTA